MQSHTHTTRSNAIAPVVYPPHPPLQSGGWYHRTSVELPGPGRPPLTAPPTRKSMSVAVLLTVLFGPLGLCYVSVPGGLVATVTTVAVLGFVGSGFTPLLVLWPLAVVAAVCAVRLRLDF
jgi:hypothetical protein